MEIVAVLPGSAIGQFIIRGGSKLYLIEQIAIFGCQHADMPFSGMSLGNAYTDKTVFPFPLVPKSGTPLILLIR